MKKERTQLLLCLVLAFLCIIPTTGAGCTKCEGYKQLSVEEGIAHFSFEYPCNWEIGIVDTSEDYTDVSVTGAHIRTRGAHLPSSTWILFVDWPDGDIPSAAAAMEDSLSFWETQDAFELLERSVVEIAGVRAELVVFLDEISRDWVRVPEPVPSISRELYFDCGGLIWNIYCSSILDAAEADNVHFEHLLETFRILD